MSKSANRPVNAILLFDIDGTLAVTQGAGTRAMSRAFREVFGIEDALAQVDFAGRSDSWIVATALRQAGREPTPQLIAEFQDAYIPALSEALRGGSRLLPGVAALLDALADQPVLLGLGTGNFRRAAQAKLGHLGVWERFVDGGFGDDAANRTELLAAALPRLKPLAAPDAEVIVIGDTRHDIEAARGIGARVIAVQTGFARPGDLITADHLLPDLANTPAVVDLLLRISHETPPEQT